MGGTNFTGERRGYFSEYRYDARGRRVLVRTRRDGLCNTTQTNTVDCTSGIERYVWAGDNILWEMRGPGGNAEPAERLEQEYAMGVEYGIVGYTHAGGVDRPLVAYKTNGGNSGAVVVPHMNWRGLFSTGTNPSGGASTTQVEWPGFRTTASHSMGETQAITKNWMGSLLEGQREAGGLMYMRNRYDDPATGQFTQTDPIGLAGGMNTYGFAAGDPVSYADPYGLDTVYVGRRHLDGELGSVGDHAAVRVKTDSSDVIGELLYVNGNNFVGTWNAAGAVRYPSGTVHGAADYEWTAVETPDGMTDEQFSAAVLDSFNRIGMERHGKDYSFTGSRNSNNFVWSVIRGAGGSMPNIHKPGRVMPGICGGRPIFVFQPGFGCQ